MTTTTSSQGMIEQLRRYEQSLKAAYTRKQRRLEQQLHDVKHSDIYERREQELKKELERKLAQERQQVKKEIETRQQQSEAHFFELENDTNASFTKAKKTIERWFLDDE